MYRKIPAAFFRTERGFVREETSLPREEKIEIRLNGVALVEMPASPEMLEELVVGFLFSSGLITGPEEIVRLDWKDQRAEVEVKNHPGLQPGPREGWGGRSQPEGAEISSGWKDLQDGYRISPEELIQGGKEVGRRDDSQPHSGKGLHFSVLRGKEGTVSSARDIARHSSMDKIIGDCILRGVSFTKKTLYVSGRISSEMVAKAARAGIPILASLRVPTDLAVVKAESRGITVVGYLRQSSFTIFSHPERVKD